ncbi:hypothetical protein OAory_01038150 [Aspergillus oryzae]|uniref:Uncharacterized protein n=1 Tax=Aspergillus oryzae TaxID=5062 RepID=A0A1S9DE21_ASPOZ|nr:hypothetical protein OAory_01038150 [Aspergillus oryzae]
MNHSDSTSNAPMSQSRRPPMTHTNDFPILRSVPFMAQHLVGKCKAIPNHPMPAIIYVVSHNRYQFLELVDGDLKFIVTEDGSKGQEPFWFLDIAAPGPEVVEGSPQLCVFDDFVRRRQLRENIFEGFPGNVEGVVMNVLPISLELIEQRYDFGDIHGTNAVIQHLPRNLLLPALEHVDLIPDRIEFIERVGLPPKAMGAFVFPYECRWQPALTVLLLQQSLLEHLLLLAFYGIMSGASADVDDVPAPFGRGYHISSGGGGGGNSLVFGVDKRLISGAEVDD